MNEVLLNKKESIEKCIHQIKKYYSETSKDEFKLDFLRQDAICMNIQRACEQAIDIANHFIRKKKLGIPKKSRESFEILENNNIIGPVLSQKLKNMVSFRNILVHEYSDIEIEIIIDIIENNLEDIIEFSNIILKLT